MCNTRIRGSLLDGDECCTRILDVFPRHMLLEERAGRLGSTEGVRSFARNHHAGRLVRRTGAQEPVVRQVLGARPHHPLPQEGHADVSVEGFGHRR